MNIRRWKFIRRIERISMLIGALTVIESMKTGCGGHTRWSNVHRPRKIGHAHKTRTALTSKQSMILYIVTVSNDAALLITAMRGNVEYPSEDAAVRQKYVFIRRPITRVYCCFPRANLMTTTTAIKRNERIGNAKRRQAS